VSSPAGRAETRWTRFLAGKTSGQRFILQVSALAAAVATIGGVALGGWKLVSGVISRVSDSSLSTSAGQTQQVQNGSTAADRFVELLVDKSKRGTPMPLDHQVHFSGIDNNQFTLQYHCDPGPCSTVTLVDYGVAAAPISGADQARWFHGCWTAERQGPGLDAVGLKVTLVRVGETCPG
jgi:hypothetical protein